MQFVSQVACLFSVLIFLLVFLLPSFYDFLECVLASNIRARLYLFINFEKLFFFVHLKNLLSSRLYNEEKITKYFNKNEHDVLGSLFLIWSFDMVYFRWIYIRIASILLCFVPLILQKKQLSFKTYFHKKIQQHSQLKETL